MTVKIRGRQVTAEAQPIRNGFFLRGPSTELFGIQAGSILEVDGSACVVKYLIDGHAGDPEVWAILLSVEKASFRAVVP